MKRLLRAIALASAAVGATYILLHLADPPRAPGAQPDRQHPLDEDELTREEKEQLLRELSSLI